MRMHRNGLQMRRNSRNDGVAGTNCAIPPGSNWTYVFQAKDEVGSFFYRPSLGLQAAAGGHGPISVNNRPVVPVPFPRPDGGELDVLIGGWYNMAPDRMRGEYLDRGRDLPSPDGVLISGLGPYAAAFTFRQGRTYRLRVSNVGARTSLSFRVQSHKLLLVEAEGAYTQQRRYASLDVHVGQSLCVLATADQTPAARPYYMVATSLFTHPELVGVANVLYAGARPPPGNAPPPSTDTTSSLPGTVLIWKIQDVLFECDPIL
jgi:FtsP/CotA-like multicopper oxidase with cupredoxin domain